MPDAAMHKLQQTVDEIVGYRRRTRKLVVGLLAVTAVSLALAVVVSILYVSSLDQAAALRTQTAALRTQTAALHSAQLANCAVSNGIKAKETALWHTLFTLSELDATSKPSAKTLRLTALFLHDVDTTFPQLNCAKAYSGG
jgi:type II secretory pathway pseudopilin PulG